MFMNKYQQWANTDIIQVLDRLAVPYRAEGRTSVRLDCPACGKVGGAVVWNNALWLNCCKGKQRHSAIDLVMLKFGVDLPAAVGILADHLTIQKHAQPNYLPEVAPAFDAKYWTDVLRKSQTALKPSADVGQYLLSRGLQPTTWQRFGLGEGTRQGQRALLLPWYGQDRNLIGGRYRLLESPDHKQRYFWWKNSDIQGHLWGWHSHQGHPALILVEGEINGASIFQACGSWVDVLSTGSENYTLTPANIAQLGRYSKLYGWADKPESVKAWAEKLPGLITLDSLSAGGDANDLQRAGRLVNYLESKR